MLNCPQCTSDNFIKSGFMKGRQHDKCKNCGFHYTVSQKSDTSSNEHRRTALILYPAGSFYLKFSGLRVDNCYRPVFHGFFLSQNLNNLHKRFLNHVRRDKELGNFIKAGKILFFYICRAIIYFFCYIQKSFAGSIDGVMDKRRLRKLRDLLRRVCRADPQHTTYLMVTLPDTLLLGVFAYLYIEVLCLAISM